MLDDLPRGTRAPRRWECTACTALVKDPDLHLLVCPAATATSPIDLSDIRAMMDPCT